jgi:hypothetical protein
VQPHEDAAEGRLLSGFLMLRPGVEDVR